MCLAQPLGGLDALIRVGGRHAYVGHDDVRPVRIDCSEERCEVVARGDDRKVLTRLEQAADAFTDEIVIVGEHDPDRHGRSIRR
jgi:hypothetical protein